MRPPRRSLLVGSRGDEVHSRTGLEELNAVIREALVENADDHPLDFNEDQGLFFYPINNWDADPDRGVTLRRRILDLSLSPSPWNDFVRQLVSLRWMRLLDKMLQDEAKRPYFSLSEVFDLARDSLIQNNAEVLQALAFFHELGIIVHLQRTAALRSIVVLDPQWLLDQLTRVLRDDIHRQSESWAQLESKVHRRKLTRAYDALFSNTSATASRALLEVLWEGQPVDFLGCHDGGHAAGEPDGAQTRGWCRVFCVAQRQRSFPR